MISVYPVPAHFPTAKYLRKLYFWAEDENQLRRRIHAVGMAVCECFRRCPVDDSASVGGGIVERAVHAVLGRHAAAVVLRKEDAVVGGAAPIVLPESVEVRRPVLVHRSVSVEEPPATFRPRLTPKSEESPPSGLPMTARSRAAMGAAWCLLQCASDDLLSRTSLPYQCDGYDE